MRRNAEGRSGLAKASNRFGNALKLVPSPAQIKEKKKMGITISEEEELKRDIKMARTDYDIMKNIGVMLHFWLARIAGSLQKDIVTSELTPGEEGLRASRIEAALVGESNRLPDESIGRSFRTKVGWVYVIEYRVNREYQVVFRNEVMASVQP